MRLPFLRRRRPPNVDPLLAERPGGGWASLPPLGRTLAPFPLTASSLAFAKAAEMKQRPPLVLAPLRHRVSPNAPSGVAHSIARPVSGDAQPAPRAASTTSETETAPQRTLPDDRGHGSVEPQPETGRGQPSPRPLQARRVLHPVALPEPPDERPADLVPKRQVEVPFPTRADRRARETDAEAPFSEVDRPAGINPVTVDVPGADSTPAFGDRPGVRRRVGLGPRRTPPEAAQPGGEARDEDGMTPRAQPGDGPGRLEPSEPRTKRGLLRQSEAALASVKESDASSSRSAPLPSFPLPPAPRRLETVEAEPGGPITPIELSGPPRHEQSAGLVASRPLAPTVRSQERDPLEPPTVPEERVPFAVQADLEPILGTDLSDVHVRRDLSVSAAARQLEARAFTTGGEVYLPAEHGSLETDSARSLLAHELTHVVQQRRFGPDLPPEGSPAGRHLEEDARRVESLRPHSARQPTPSGIGVERHRKVATPPPMTSVSAGGPRVFDPGPSTTIQRATEEPGAASVEAPPAPPAGPPGGDMDELAASLYERIRAKLTAELLVDRERSGLLLDL
jgi:hypothetical protein